MQELQQKCAHLVVAQSFDSVSVSIIDFARNSFETISQNPFEEDKLFFDLASLTKPLTLGLSFLRHRDLYDADMKLLLNHQAGLPAWGKLSKHNWKKQITEYPISASATEYSDFSALRLMLELEKRSGKSLQKMCRPYWDDDVMFWKDLPMTSFSPLTGFRNEGEIMGEVNDDNAYMINEFCSHAGLFSTIDGISKTLLTFSTQVDLLKQIELDWDESNRFVNGWDRVTDLQTTLAGDKCSSKTFGHLGFTGTSIWIDIEKKRGLVILTNATQKFWYDRDNLNQFRKDVGNIVWSL